MSRLYCIGWNKSHSATIYRAGKKKLEMWESSPTFKFESWRRNTASQLVSTGFSVILVVQIGWDGSTGVG